MTWSSRLSIRHRLLLLIAATILAVVAVHDVVAYIELRRSALALASEQLEGMSGRLLDMLRAQTRGMRDQLGAVARDASVVSFLRGDRGGDARDRARAALRKGMTTPTVISVELRGADGRLLLTTRAAITPRDSARGGELLELVGARDSVALGAMRVVADTVLYPVVARSTEAGATLGYVVEWRRASGGARARQQLAGLVGPEAAVYLGNTAGDGWTDFARAVPAPRFPLSTPGVFSHTGLEGGPHLVVTRALPGTAWTLALALAQTPVLAPVWVNLRRLAAITGLLLAIAIGVAWILGSRLTTPLAELAGAATAISAGDYSRRVAAAGADEVGALGRAFNHMAESVATAHRGLEERSEELADRAGQLAEQAAQLEIANEELADSIDEAVRTRDELSAALGENARITAELDACLAGAPVGFAFHDAEMRFRRVNASLAALNGVAEEAHVGQLPSAVAPGIGRELEEHARRALDRDGGVFNVELSGETPARPGTAQHWLASFYPIRTRDGERLGVGSVVTDLTAYKQLERQFLQAQKMEAVGRLAGGVAHDFNNILTAISGFGQFALADLDGAGDPKEDIEQVLAAAGRAATLTRQLLAFSRQQVLQPQVLDLDAVVQGLSPMLARLIGEDVRLVARPAPRLGAVTADPGQVEQVLVNLVVNARDAMPNGGTVVIETRDVELDATYAMAREGVVPGPYVMLAVTDTGTGMDAATQARAFDPFFTTKAPGKGTGLGLSTVYGIVKQSGGSVDVYSEPGRGTTFKVYLPRSEGPRAARHTPAPGVVAVPDGRATVLLVDDDPYVSAAARRALERAGYEVLTATNGREGLRVAEEHADSLGLLITDLVMPEMGGRELARRLAATRPDVRVLFTSGYTAEAMNQQAVLEPGDAFLGKPFTPDMLLRRVHEILRAAA